MSSGGHRQGYVWTNTEYSRGIVDTLAQAATIPNPIIGESVFCNENMRMLTYDGELWMCGDFIKCLNTSGSTRQQGDPMVVKNSTTGTLPEVIVPSSSGSALFAGVVAFASASNAVVALAFKGIYKCKISFFSNGISNTVFELLRTSSTGGLETIPSAVGVSAGHIGWIIEQPSSSVTPQLCWCLLRGKTEYYF